MSRELMRYQKKLQTYMDTYIRHLGELEALEQTSEPHSKRKVKAKQSQLLEDKAQIVQPLAVTPPVMPELNGVYPFPYDAVAPAIGVNHAPKTLKDVEALEYAGDAD